MNCVPTEIMDMNINDYQDFFNPKTQTYGTENKGILRFIIAIMMSCSAYKKATRAVAIKVYRNKFQLNLC